MTWDWHDLEPPDPSIDPETGERLGPPMSDTARKACADLHASLPDPPTWSDDRLAHLPEPVEPHELYPWLEVSHHARLDGDAKAGARFARVYGWHWRDGPNGEHKAVCDTCGRSYHSPNGHECPMEAP